MVGGKIVYAAGDFARFDSVPPPPAMPDWSPVRLFGGYAAWGAATESPASAARREIAAECGCTNHCSLHGHDHAQAWSGRLPVGDLKGFWGALGCSCFAF